MGDKDGLVVVKDERNRSPTYRPTSLYAGDVYPMTTHLNAEYLRNDDERDVARQYRWMPTDVDDSAVDCSKGREHAVKNMQL